MMRWQTDSLLKVINAIAFQAGWFACVLGAVAGYPFVGPLFVAAFILFTLVVSDAPKRVALVVVVAACGGFLLDSGLSAAGFYRYLSSHPDQWWAPLWAVGLWANFAASLRSSLGWLAGRVWLASLLGALGGPLSYLAGERLGAVRISSSATFLVLGVCWALIAPGLLWLDLRLTRGPGGRSRFRPRDG